MARKIDRITVDRSEAGRYYDLGEQFFRAAEESLEVGFEHWNAIGVLIVHGAIAFMDGVTISRAGLKARGEDHVQAVRLLEESVPEPEGKKSAMTQLRRLMGEKNRVSYSGELYTRKDVEKMRTNLKRFRSWVRARLDIVEPPLVT